MTSAMRNTPTLHCSTSRFGEIDVEQDLIITLHDGIIGFEECRRFVVLHADDRSPFRWFQSLDDGSLAFPIVDPWQFMANYCPAISDSDAAALELTTDSPKLVFAIVTVPRNEPKRTTANLLAPIVINPIQRIGKQVIVTDEHYSTRHSIMDEVNRKAAA